MIFLEIKKLSEKYGDIYVLRDFDLRVVKGEFVSIVGKFGVGKSTLLKIIAGLMPIYNGSILIGGLTPKEAIKRRIVGIKFQKSNLLPWRSVLENLLLPLELAGINDKDRAFQLLRLVNLEVISDLRVSQLSGGTEQLISILRSLVLNPELLLLDEPFSSLDEITREDLYEKIKLIHIKEKKTTLMITHSIDEAVKLSDRIVVLSDKPTRVKEIFDNKASKFDINEIRRCLK
ncbi:MAG: ATP-binding cassette domain-containing protein [Candidatus Pacebacteria bacterium]|jgi:NitT/TauT family transport system ATP-binding protein|nr:ATP-binding cassette domain-containing protein [Candidatus Paceibacterota bacterium]